MHIHLHPCNAFLDFNMLKKSIPVLMVEFGVSYSCYEYLFSAFRSIAENICLKRFDRKQMVNEALR